MAHYLTDLDTDITDANIRIFVANDDDRIEAWQTRVDTALENLALIRGLSASAIVTPIVGYVKEFCVSYFCLLVAQDSILYVNNAVPTEDKYLALAEIYKIRTNELFEKVTSFLLTQTVPVYPGEMVTGVNIFRG